MDISQITLLLPYDKTGTNTNNRVLNEIHTLVEDQTIIKPKLSAYFSQSLVIRKTINNVTTTLVRGTDYKCTDFLDNVSADTGKEVCLTITLINNNSSTLSIDYQAVGGEAYGNASAIAGVLADLNKDQIFLYDDIKNKPTGFQPTLNHQHDWLDIYGADYLVNFINSISQAISVQDSFYTLDINNKLHQILTKLNSVTPATVLNNTKINTLYTDYQNTVDTINYIKKYLKQFNMVDYNRQLSIILSFIMNDKYSKSSLYSSLYPLISEVSGLSLWLDFSDSSKLSLDGSNKVISITDKSSNAYVFSQATASKRPTMINNTNIGAGKINKNTSANFVTGNNLKLNSGVFSIGNNFTLIILGKIKTTSGYVLFNSNNTNKVTIKDYNNSAINITSNKFNIRSNINSVGSNDYLLNMLSVGDKSISNIFNISNYTNSGVYGLNYFSDTRSITTLDLDSIGDNTTNVQDYELAEVIVYNRQLSLMELSAVNTYLSRKWSGASDFNIDMDRNNLTTNNPNTDTFWIYN